MKSNGSSETLKPRRGSAFHDAIHSEEPEEPCATDAWTSDLKEKSGQSKGYGMERAVSRGPSDSQSAAPGSCQQGMPSGLSVSKYVLSMSEKTMPGDIRSRSCTSAGEDQPIWDRMATLIRSRGIHMRVLIDAHDRYKRGFVPLSTFRRALCSAFGSHWTELGMTSSEFTEVIEPYLTRTPTKPGEPEACVMWHKFAEDVQTYAEDRTRSVGLLKRYEHAGTLSLFRSSQRSRRADSPLWRLGITSTTTFPGSTASQSPS